MSGFLPALRACLLLGLLALPLAAAAEDEKPHIATKEEVQKYVDDRVAKLHLRTGTILLPEERVTLTLPDEFGYLSPDESEILLHEIWGNPPAKKTFGIVTTRPLDVASKTSWAIVLNYNNEGHVSDVDAKDLNYDEILKEMQAATEQANVKRKENGYSAVHLVGWAEKPHYDPATHKLYWAKEFVSDGSDERFLNYDVRVLGREGVLIMSIVGSMDQLPMIREQRDKILSFVNFNVHSRYEDFNGATDRKAAYGMAALIAGGMAAKLGLFKWLFAIIIAFKKIFLVVFLAITAVLNKLLVRVKQKAKSGQKTTTPDPET